MEFKVGDKVRVVCVRKGAHRDKANLIGKSFDVVDVSIGREYPYILQHEPRWRFKDSELELCHMVDLQVADDSEVECLLS